MSFCNISKTSKGTIKNHSTKEAEFNGILFDTAVEYHNTPKYKSGTLLEIDISVYMFSLIQSVEAREIVR